MVGKAKSHVKQSKDRSMGEIPGKERQRQRKRAIHTEKRITPPWEKEQIKGSQSNGGVCGLGSSGVSGRGEQGIL